MTAPFADPRRAVSRAVVALAAIAGVSLLALAAGAAKAPKVQSPHGTFKEDCSLCHAAGSWTPAKPSPKFDHGRSGFPLDGAHAAAGCRTCHASLDFKQARTQCASCHEDVHRGEMGSDCARCHGSQSFIDRARMGRMHQMTRFPLTGGHAGLDCESCHPRQLQGQLQFVGTRADCQGCHQADYDATTAPAHRAGRFPLECATCHSPGAWRPSRFDHGRSAFPLTGAHRAVACDVCHGDGVYKGKDTRCISCHLTEWNGTANPAHAAAGFPNTCQSCHNTTSWDGANFDHAGTAFPLTGAHRPLACSTCHGDGVYDGKPSTCVSCHRGDYDGTTDPAHAGAGFPVTCQDCHNTTGWDGANFDHDGRWFPINSGRHAGRWANCATCHTVATNYAQFTCFNCHPHSDKAKTDGDHSGRSGYSYDSARCYACHPRGEAD
jgi:DnaJ-class molecular chaperone